MLSNILNTNEIKNAAGTEQEFGRLLTNERKTVFGLLTEAPSSPHRLTIQHGETGAGLTKRRRSVCRFDKTVISSVDSVTPVTVSGYVVMDIPVGALTAITEATNVLAELGSFVHTLGTNTHLYDGTGTGAAALLSGGL